MEFIVSNQDNEDITLALTKDDEGITLTGTESDGTRWDLMIFDKGRFELVPHISENIGIDVDTKGRIKEKK